MERGSLGNVPDEYVRSCEPRLCGVPLVYVRNYLMHCPERLLNKKIGFARSTVRRILLFAVVIFVIQRPQQDKTKTCCV